MHSILFPYALIVLKQWLKEVYTKNNDMGQGWLKEKHSNSHREKHIKLMISGTEKRMAVNNLMQISHGNLKRINIKLAAILSWKIKEQSNRIQRKKKENTLIP
jgi:hypothetical protein